MYFIRFPLNTLAALQRQAEGNENSVNYLVNQFFSFICPKLSF